MLRYLTESEIGIELYDIKLGVVTPADSLNNFSSRNINGKWVVEFNKRTVSGYSIRTTNGGAKRTFITLGAVANWMKRMGIKEFKVIL